MQNTKNVLTKLSESLVHLPRELSKAAIYLLENPAEIAISSTREIASGAGVKPNTLVRLSRAIGFSGFEDMRTEFRQGMRNRPFDFRSRANALQEISRDGQLNSLHAVLCQDSLDNIAKAYAATDSEIFRNVAKSVATARRAYVLGVGVSTPFVRYFAYLTDMAVNNVQAIPRYALLPIDGLSGAGKDDALIAMTFKPYRRDILDAVAHAKSVGMTITAISDSPASPIMSMADFQLVSPTQTPQFFPSMVGVAALLEGIVAYLVAGADESAIAKIESFHQRRSERDIYLNLE